MRGEVGKETPTQEMDLDVFLHDVTHDTFRNSNYQKSDCLVKCFWSEENRESAKKYLQTNRK